MKTNRTWVIVGVTAVVVIAALVIFLVVDRPWESREYKDCVRQAETLLGNDFDKSEIERYCHELTR